MHKKILVVDDDDVFLDELSEALSLQGFQVIEVDDPFAVSEAIERTSPDAILLDLKMPHKSGLQLAYELKNNSLFMHIPIIAMSAFFKESFVALLKSCGINKCLKKPFNPENIVEEINNSINEHQEKSQKK